MATSSNSPDLYFDFAAATPMSKSVVQAMQPFWADDFYNPSAMYLAAKNVKSTLSEARSSVARQLGVRPSEITFVAGGSEANNLAIQGVMKRFPDKKVLTSAIEHDSIREVAKTVNAAESSVDTQGIIDLEDLARKIDDNTVLVSIMYANNEIGSVQPLKDVARLIANERKKRQKSRNKTPIYLHTDACQAANYLDLHVNKLGVDLMTLNGGKMYGPKQSGILYVRAGIELEPLIYGGGQEHGLRSGTENVAAAVGFAVALEEATRMRVAETMRLIEVRDFLLQKLTEVLPDVEVNGPKKHRLPNNIHVTFPEWDNERLLMELDELGVQCATGSACSASKEESSHVLKAIGLTDEQARGSLRFTLGRTTTKASVEELIDRLIKIISK